MNLEVQAMVDLLDGHIVGWPLVKELKARFPHAKRDDVFLAIGMALTLKEADLMIYEGLGPTNTAHAEAQGADNSKAP